MSRRLKLHQGGDKTGGCNSPHERTLPYPQIAGVGPDIECM